MVKFLALFRAAFEAIARWAEFAKNKQLIDAGSAKERGAVAQEEKEAANRVVQVSPTYDAALARNRLRKRREGKAEDGLPAGTPGSGRKNNDR